MKLLSRVSSAIRWLTIGKACSQAISWLFTILTIRLLTPEDYGLLALASVIYAFAVLFQELGLRLHIVQMRELDLDLVRAIYGLSLVFNVVLAALVIISAPLTAWFFGDDRITAIVLALSSVLLIGAFATVPDAMFAREMDFRTITIIDIAVSILSAVTTVALAYLGFGVWALVSGMIVNCAARTAALVLLQKTKVRPSLQFLRLTETIRFGAYMTGQRVVWMAYSCLDRVLLGRLYDPAVTGLYSVAGELANLPLAKLSAIVQLTAFAGLARTTHDEEMFRRYLIKGLSLVAIIGFPVGFGISAVAPELTALLFGDRWAGVDVLVAILALIVPFRLISGPLTESLNACNRPGAAFRVTVVLGVAVCAGVAIGVSWGPIGVAIGWLVGYLLGFAASAVMTARLHQLSWSALPIAIVKPMIAATAMLVATWQLRRLVDVDFPSVGGLAITVAAGAAVYATLIFILAKREVLLLRESLMRQ